MNNDAMARKPKRIGLSDLGEWYTDLLTIDAWITGMQPSGQAASLLKAKLQEREPRIFQRLEYLAKKRNMSADELRNLILNGEIENLEPESND